MDTQNNNSLQSIRNRFGRHLESFFFQMRFFLIAVLITGLADMSTTIACMLRWGVQEELHPAIALVCSFLGPVLGPITGKLGQFAAILLVTIYLKSWAKALLALTSVLYLAAAVYNLWIYNL